MPITRRSLCPVRARTAVPAALAWLAWLAAGTAAGACGARSDIDELGGADPREPLVPDAGATRVDASLASDAATEAHGSLFDARVSPFAEEREAPPPTPRPIAPLSTSRVTSHRPTFHWELPPELAAATIDVCLDRACRALAIPSVTVAGTQYTPAADLPPGMLYWRLHSAADSTATSPTWQFLVGARNAPVDTSWGTTLDVNGDGFADVAVGTTTGAYLVMGSAAGLSAVPAAQFSRNKDSAGSFGAAVASAGDVNGRRICGPRHRRPWLRRRSTLAIGRVHLLRRPKRRSHDA